MRRRGFALADLMAIVFVITILAVLALFTPPSCAPGRPNVKILKDATQMKMIHQAWTIYANEHEDRLPTPGLINRRPVLVDGQIMDVPGVGDEELAFNTTPYVHSACIMQNYYPPEICVGPTEPNPVVVVVKKDYDWEAYDAVADVYWDPSFRGDLDELCHFSYASIPVCGERQASTWKNTFNNTTAAIGNRGPRNGVSDPASLANLTHGTSKAWRGNVCYADNFIKVETSFTPPGAEIAPGQPDNLFAQDTADGDLRSSWDNFLAIVSSFELDQDDADVIAGWTLEWD